MVIGQNDIHKGQNELLRDVQVERKQVSISKVPEIHQLSQTVHESTTVRKGLKPIKEDLRVLHGKFWTKEELLLAQLCEAEAGTQGMRGKQLVADVVLNRVDSDIFPNTIYKVIHQKHQFSVIDDGRFAKMASRITEESLKAARKELKGPRIDSRILYFNSGSYCMNGSGGWKYKDHWFAY